MWKLISSEIQKKKKKNQAITCNSKDVSLKHRTHTACLLQDVTPTIFINNSWALITLWNICTKRTKGRNWDHNFENNPWFFIIIWGDQKKIVYEVLSKILEKLRGSWLPWPYMTMHLHISICVYGEGRECSLANVRIFFNCYNLSMK